MAMARFAQENPQYYRNELEFYWKRGIEKEDEDGPSTGSSSSPTHRRRLHDSDDFTIDVFCAQFVSDPSSSFMSGNVLSLGGDVPVDDEAPTPPATPPASRSSSSSSTASSASSSSSRSSRRWGFIKDLLHRSKSDGGKDSQRTAAPAPPTFSATPKRSPSPSPSRAAARSRGAGRGRRMSAHERLYEARRAEAEEMRRRTYLPYRQGGLLIFGCIGLGNRSYGTAVHGLARGLNTATATAVSSRFCCRF
uniref:Uncharacterized protein n=1 Tax=Aegilops tauschii TaxID=37682 RepID=M8CB15_AEGTA